MHMLEPKQLRLSIILNDFSETAAVGKKSTTILHCKHNVHKPR